MRIELPVVAYRLDHAEPAGFEVAVFLVHPAPPVTEAVLGLSRMPSTVWTSLPVQRLRSIALAPAIQEAFSVACRFANAIDPELGVHPEYDLESIPNVRTHATEEQRVTASIYEDIGGAEAVRAAVDDFYERVLADPELKPYFDGYDVNEIKRHQRAFLTAALGGSELYEGRDMGAAHAHLNIRPDHFDRVVGHLVATLTSLNVPDDVIAAIGAKLAPLKDVIVVQPA